MKKIFIDANILVDFFDRDATEHQISTLLLNVLLNEYKILVSPTSFAITSYLFPKTRVEKNKANSRLVAVFSAFTFTREDHNTMKRVFKSKFKDLEDALQYFSAEDAAADCIVTKNTWHFYHSKIPVLHPLVFLEEHYNSKGN